MEQCTITIISISVAALAALGAVVAAIGSWKSAHETRKTSLAQILLQITDAYGSEEMNESIKRLYAHKDKYDEDFARVFSQLLSSKEKEQSTYAKQLDGDRRRVSYYFHQIKSLLDCGVIDENFVRKLVKSDQVDTLLDIVEPLEKARNEDYDHSTFDTFRRIYCKESFRGTQSLF